MKKYAPIALFTFKRPEHTRRTLEALTTNTEFLDSPLFVFCDGARNEGEEEDVESTRQTVRDCPHPNKTIIERDKNWGLANSVIAGVTDLCERFGRVIVVEDDLIVSPVFLNYMNTALDKYVDEPKVMQISGYMFPVEINASKQSMMLPITSTWGWATWASAWEKFGAHEKKISELFVNTKTSRSFDLDDSYPYTRRLKQQIDGKSDSWGIRWYWSVFNEGGNVVYPPESLVQNIGNDGSGTHCTVEKNQGEFQSSNKNIEITFPKGASISFEEFDKVKKYLQSENSVFLRGRAWLRTKLKKVFGGAFS